MRVAVRRAKVRRRPNACPEGHVGTIFKYIYISYVRVYAHVLLLKGWTDFDVFD